MGIIQNLLNFHWYRRRSFLKHANGVVLRRATLQMQRRSYELAQLASGYTRVWALIYHQFSCNHHLYHNCLSLITRDLSFSN